MKDQATAPAFILFGQPEVEKVTKPTTERLVSGEAREGVWLYCDDAQTGSKFGQWDCTEGRFRVTMEGYTEFCHLLEGEAEITVLASGETRTVKAGDSFVMQAGLEMEWHVPRYISKSFVVSSLV